MLGIELRNMASLVVLVAASVAPAPATADVSGPPPQDVRATPIGHGQIHVSWSDPLPEAGSTTEYRYKIQWRSGSQEYGTAREAISTGTDAEIVWFAGYLDDPALRYDLFHRLEGMEDGVEYTVRVIRVSSDGESEPSEEASATPVTSEELLAMTVDDLIVRYGEDSPWIELTWEFFRDDMPFFIGEIDSGASGKYRGYCDPDPVSGLHLCTTGSICLDDPVNEDLILHEFAHAYSLDVGILEDHPDEAEGVAIAFIYLGTLIDEPNNACNREEFLADLMSFRELGDKADPYYWRFCGYPSIPQEALEIVGSALDGKPPDWFNETYSGSATPDLERLWADIQDFAPRIANYHHREQQVVVYNLRNAFGGYCDNANATASMFGDGPTRNPWREGGCVPTAPSVAVAPGNDADVTVSWTVPRDDGGAPVEGYKIQWRSGGQQYGGSSQVVISDPSTLRYRLRGLIPGVRHQVRVLAYNTNGDGTPSDELEGMIDRNHAGSPWSPLRPEWLIG
ncbi:MAG: fibronectin type III domain-containing protein [bacterium]|nr:fibronectin type III domain-containing protein [bacterium]MDE0289202.1 fibronectin type III domain-containing protein [bacterium]MDE0437427.1 fibronectin type III domain-containing protein [bacterium]